MVRWRYVALSLGVLPALAGCWGSGRWELGPLARPTFSPDGEHILFASRRSGSSELYLMDADGRGLRQLTHTAEEETEPAFSRDGTRVVYSERQADPEEGGRLCVLSLKDGRRRYLTSGGKAYDSSPSFTPNGSRVVFVRSETLRPYSMGGKTWAGNCSIHVIGSDGSGDQRITAGGYYSLDAPVVSPDGRHVLTSTSMANGPGYQESDEVVLLPMPHAPGSRPLIRLTRAPRLRDAAPPFPEASKHPCYSRDGKRIAFVSNRVTPPGLYAWEVWVMRADGTHPRQVTQNHSYNAVPAFDPSGKRILFLSDPGRNEQFSLWVVDTDGRNLRRLADPRLFNAP